MTKEKQQIYNKEYYKRNRESILYRIKNTPMGRATNLLSRYNSADKEKNREKGNLTAQWIVDNIFSQPCAHCGKTGWDVIGCNRLDNSKPHTMDNVEPCCEECNKDLGYSVQSKKVYQYDLENNLIAIYSSTGEAARKTGCSQAHIAACCRGERKTHKGYKWSYIPL